MMSWSDVHEKLSRYLDPDLSRILCQLYEKSHLPWIVRRKYSAWFEDQKWPDAMDDQMARELYDELISSIQSDIDQLKTDPELILEAVDLINARSTIEEYFSNDPIQLVQAVIKALDGEKTLISGYTGPERMEEDLEDIKVSGDKYRNELEELSRLIETLITLTSKASSNLTCSNQKRGHLSELKSDFSNVSQNAQLNGQRDMLLQVYQEKIKECQTSIDNHITEFATTKREVQDQLRQMVATMESLANQILDEVKTFKHLQKLAYVGAESANRVRTMLQEIEGWCGDLGSCCWKLIQQTRSPDLREVISTAHQPLHNGEGPLTPILAAEDNAEVEELGRCLEQLFREMLEKTFLVTTQPPELIKMVGTKGNGNSRGDFNVSVGILALNCLQIEQISSQVTAQFTAETDIGRDRKTVTCQLQNSKAQFKTIGKKRAEACFSELKVKDFSRGRDNDESRVSKQFYRVILNTKVTVFGEWEYNLETMSLPIIVNTGSNQACEALGSLLWYCYNTEDMYSNLNQVSFPNEVPLDRVLNMLNSCLKAISPRELKEDERRFLGEKLTGKSIKKPSGSEGVVPSPMVTFHQFCVVSLSNKMRLNKDKNVEFSFWKWFQAVINLIEKYLKEPWRDGVIKGFVSKTTVQRILKTQAPGTFLIRFSESCVNGDHQGVTGGIVVALRYEDMVTFSPPRVEGHLSKTSLSAILRQFINHKNGEALLKTLYKSNCSHQQREIAFKKYDRVPSEKKNDQYYSGYPGWVAFLGLDRDFSAMKLGDGDVSDDPAFPDKHIWTVSHNLSLYQVPSGGDGARRKKARKNCDSPSRQMSGSVASQADSNSSTESGNIPNIVQNYHVDKTEADVQAFLKNFGNTQQTYQPQMNFTQSMHGSSYGTGVAQQGSNFGFMPQTTTSMMMTGHGQSSLDPSEQMQQQMAMGSPSSGSSASTNDYSVEHTHSPSSLSPDLIEIQPSLPPFGFEQNQASGQAMMSNTGPYRTPAGYLDLLTDEAFSNL